MRALGLRMPSIGYVHNWHLKTLLLAGSSGLQCLHGGKCYIKDQEYKCGCHKTGYEGPQCEKDIDECSNPRHCSNRGICTNKEGSFDCACDEGYDGNRCQVDQRCMALSPCQNGGVCRLEEKDKYSCQCQEGWTGQACETSVQTEDYGDEEEDPTGGNANEGNQGTTNK